MSNSIMGPEDREQQTIFEWAQLMINTGKYSELELMYAIPNGGYRHKATAARLKLTGVKSGVPDICLPVARGDYHGLYIELKAGDGVAQKSQLVWQCHLTGQGYRADICKGNQQATDLIEWYLKLT